MAALASHRGQSGFTLLELLAVIAIIAVLAAGVVLSLPGAPRQQMREEAKRLQQALQLADDEAVFQGDEIGAYFTPDGYGFLRYDGEARRWQVLRDGALRPHALPDPLRLSLALGGYSSPLQNEPGAETARPALLFLPSGEMTPFVISLSIPGEPALIDVTGDGIAPILLRQEPAP